MSKILASTVYGAYDGSDLLPIDPPKDGQTLQDYFQSVVKPAHKAGELGDSLFYFICAEIHDVSLGSDDLKDQIKSAVVGLDNALGQIEDVVDALERDNK